MATTPVTDPPQTLTEVAGLLDERLWTGRIFSDGWVDAPAVADVIEPATGATLGIAGMGDADTVDRAARSAARAQREWAQTNINERARIVRRAGEIIEANRAELVRWLVRETGSIAPKADNEVSASIGQIEQAAALISHPQGILLPSLTPGRSSTARRTPIGVVGVITPWNFPIVLAMRSVAPALVLGNAVVLKADPNTPITGAALLARAFEEAGLPSGLLHAFAGGPEVGEALVNDPRVRMISFTGSNAAGRKVGEAAGRNLKRVVLELGGNSPLIVLDDADIEAASSAGAWGSFLHQGQICLATSRHLVHESIVEPYLEALVTRAARLPFGNPDTDEVALGPIINARQLERVQRIVDESVAQGAAALVGGKPDGRYFPATVLADVSRTMPAFAEEIFGPVAPVIPFRDDDEAVELANATEYGLAAAVQSGDAARASAIADRLHAGMVHVNDQTVNEEPPAPFGGFGASSNGGHFGGVANLELWTEWQWLTVRPHAQPFPF
ncbi:MAG: NAD-dependent aldehyde dehydrogenase [Solirubrobacterales bacterium]|nr:NAD-dependent aldehyde dehydrogenase [Solirubrobacterales bacterium]